MHLGQEAPLSERRLDGEALCHARVLHADILRLSQPAGSLVHLLAKREPVDVGLGA